MPGDTCLNFCVSSESSSRRTHDNTGCMGLSNFACLEEFDQKDSAGKERCAGGAWKLNFCVSSESSSWKNMITPVKVVIVLAQMNSIRIVRGRRGVPGVRQALKLFVF